MCEYCEKKKKLKSNNFCGSATLIVSGNILDIYGDENKFNIFKKIYRPRFDINYCPMCRKEVNRMSKKQILNYCLELENVKENELPEKDIDKIIQFNNSLSDKYGLYVVNVLENDNLYFRGRIISNTKSENNAKLKLLIAELNEFYKKYNLKKVIKSMVAYGHVI